ncbi:hypothetical protein ACFP1I_32280 [Dyadobacter subterraneus]|uniref:Uncharacterized protein n=1 Tax=Dyadobacter subterraneus TaxID=2773304 RepID=A0ABR9WE66_9BACT|nr:hypothetical protein [Dyadobacter subterraneus]MBE9463698.1 hypothetical protein [Dyadobacter subterraneus]
MNIKFSASFLEKSKVIVVGSPKVWMSVCNVGSARAAANGQKSDSSSEIRLGATVQDASTLA